ncbi:MAG TPA: shikimate kinase, partial [bacterium]|nr:shikimate kinase [bacterium]
MNVVLIGYRGTGKSTVAQIVARNLGWEALSLDQMIVQKAGKAIPKIVDELGWEYFRDLESEVVVETAGRDKVVLDCGGGVILRAANVQALKDKGKVFLLTATPDTIVSRIKEDTNRPALIQGKTFLEEIAEVLESRNPLYRAAADVQIATDDKT